MRSKYLVSEKALCYSQCVNKRPVGRFRGLSTSCQRFVNTCSRVRLAEDVLFRNTRETQRRKSCIHRGFSHWTARYAKRVRGYGPEGREFESSPACHQKPSIHAGLRDWPTWFPAKMLTKFWLMLTRFWASNSLFGGTEFLLPVCDFLGFCQRMSTDLHCCVECNLCM